MESPTNTKPMTRPVLPGGVIRRSIRSRAGSTRPIPKPAAPSSTASPTAPISAKPASAVSAPPPTSAAPVIRTCSRSRSGSSPPARMPKASASSAVVSTAPADAGSRP